MDDDKVYLVNPETSMFVESVNADLIKNFITEWRHPDTCAECAANPETAALVQVAEAANAKALEAMLPFFFGNPNPEVLLNLFMSGFLAQQKYMDENLRMV